MTSSFSDNEIKAIINHNPLSKHYYRDGDEDKLEPVKNFQVKDDDVFLFGFLKSGTTWAQEMVWLIANDFDYEGAKVLIDERFPILELSALFNKELMPPTFLEQEYYWNSVKYIEGKKSPRFIKSHLGPKQLPTQLINGEKQPRIIYIGRNVKDVCVSQHFYFTEIDFISCSFEDSCKLFLADINPIGKYWESILYFWEHRNEDHILFIKYEDMKNNLVGVIQKVAKFLNKLLTKEREEELLKRLQFDFMKNNSAVNHESIYNTKNFMRKGKIGDHKIEMSPEMISKFDIWTEESLKNSDYKM